VVGLCCGFLVLVVAVDPSFFNNNQPNGLRRLFLCLRLLCVAGWLGLMMQAERLQHSLYFFLLDCLFSES